MTEKEQARLMHFCQKPASRLLTYKGLTRGYNSPGAESLRGRRMIAEGDEKSRQCHK